MEKHKIQTIGITGISGFIGYHVARFCLEKGHKVIGLERVKCTDENPEITYIYGDIRDKEVVSDFVGRCDGVINLAGILGTSEQINGPLESVDTNIKGALNFYEAVRRFNIPAVQITVGNIAWFNSYAISKYCAERFAIMYNQEHKTKIAVVRGLNVYGAKQKYYPVRKVVPNFIRSALLNETIQIYGDGKQLLDVIYVQDTAEILYNALILDHGCYDRVMEAGSGKVITCNHLAKEIIRISGSESTIKYLPMRAGEPKHSVTKADLRTLKPIGGYKFTSLKVGLRETIQWYKDNKSFLKIEELK